MQSAAQPTPSGAFELAAACGAPFSPAASTRTFAGTPLRTALPHSRREQVIGQVVDADAGMSSARWPGRCPGGPWPQPCGMLTTPGMTSSVSSAERAMLPTRERTWWTRCSAVMPRRGVLQVDEQGAARRAFDQAVAVMQPGVVAAGWPPADELVVAAAAAVALSPKNLLRTHSKGRGSRPRRRVGSSYRA